MELIKVSVHVKTKYKCVESKKKKKKLNSKTINRADCLGEKSAVHRFFQPTGKF